MENESNNNVFTTLLFIFCAYVLMHLIISRTNLMTTSDNSGLISLVKDAYTNGSHFEYMYGAFLDPYIDVYTIIQSDLILNFTSILLFILALIAGLQILELYTTRFKYSFMLVLAIHPASIAFNSLFMNESIEFFSVIFLTLNSIRLIRHGTLYNTVYYLIAVYLFILSHYGFSFVAFFLHIIMIIISTRTKKNTLVIIFLLISLSLNGYIVTQDNLYKRIFCKYRNNPACAHYTITNFTTLYTSNTIKPRTEYALKYARIGSNYPIIKPLVFYVSYFIEPLWYSVSNIIDITIYITSWIRIILLMILLIQVRNIKIEKDEKAILLASYLLLTFAFSFGTGNFGTSFRHHIITDWLIVLLALVACASKNNRLNLTKLPISPNCSLKSLFLDRFKNW
jgi:hypothetical protein